MLNTTLVQNSCIYSSNYNRNNVVLDFLGILEVLIRADKHGTYNLFESDKSIIALRYLLWLQRQILFHMGNIGVANDFPSINDHSKNCLLRKN